jgi:sugar/nucleoside kinase (ribokinase family)
MTSRSPQSTPKSLFFGRLVREFFILSDDQLLLDVPGGGPLYSAVGYQVWGNDPPPGLVARVGEDFPKEWLLGFEDHGMDTRGIRVLAEPVDLRSFSVYTSRATRIQDDPVPHFARIAQPFPRPLLGYRPPHNLPDSRTRLTNLSIRQSDLPEVYFEATSAHLCPLDYLTHSLIPAILRQSGFTTITLDPSEGCMTPVFWDDIPAMVIGLTAFLPSEDEVRSLYSGRSTDLWEMMDGLAAMGCEFVIVKRGVAGQYLLDASSHSRWEVPSYPARFINPTGAGDAFCGGFLAGYLRTFDPLQAVLHGNISASLVIEGVSPYFAKDVLQGLPQARLEALKESVIRR